MQPKMAPYLLCLVLFRVLLPILFSVCIIFRPSGLSCIYLLLLLCLPLVPVPTFTSMSGVTGIYLKVLIAISVLTTLSQLTFQITLLATPPYGHFLENCTILEKALRHGGFVRLNNSDAITILTWLSPEIIMLLTSIAAMFAFKRLLAPAADEEMTPEENADKKETPDKHLGLLVSIGRFVVMVTLCLAAVLRPSAIGGFYFLVFLCTATWWACYKQLKRGFAIFLRVLMVVVALHMCALYAYQFQWPQEALHPEDSYARYFGLKAMFNISCADGEDPRVFRWVEQEIATYILPVALFWLYFICALESKGLLQPQSQKKMGPFSRLEGSLTGSLGRQMSQRLSSKQLMRTATTKRRWQSATRKVRVKSHSDTEKIGETTPLIRGGMGSSSSRYGSGKKTASIIQDSTGSVTITGENTEDIPLEQLGKGTSEDEYKPSTIEKVIFVLETLLQVVIKASYIATNIIMMAWSIKYLSWITFVLLIWSNILWLVPNQRKSMLRSSPFLVAYAWFLLISAYIYSMDLNDSELPSEIKEYDLSQIGFTKEPYMPCNPLIVKCLFTAMFWITLRQFMQERVAKRQSSALADMVAPLQVTVGTATGVNRDQEQSKRLMDKLGIHLKKFLTKFWIWVVAATLFAVAITGQKMTGFRICYMALFLFFILTFQLSFRFWRRMMFTFWLVVIVYSMIILVMVYTYQFKNIPKYWEKYLHVDESQQQDIGLKTFQVKELFIRLFTPTCFVIITVIQLHYFHTDFMEISDPKNIVPVANVDLENSSLQGGAAVVLEKTSEKDITFSSSGKYDLSGVEKIASQRFKEILQTFLRRFHKTVNLSFLFLELHMPKIVLLFAMLLCVYDKCASYLVILVMIALSLLLGRAVYIFSIHASAILVSVMLLARMVYQIKYIQPENWAVTCVINATANTSRIVNNADWFGLLKVNDNLSLTYMLRWNITYLVVVSVWAVVLVRQYNYRVSRGKPTTRAFFMFPRITRNEADRNLRNMIKYLFNYGFYKFGVEISLMATVALIGFRMDLYAVIYSIWLCALFALSRGALSKIWVFYQSFIAVFLIIQYFMVIGLPPSLCIILPWELNEFYRRVQEWAFLLDYVSPPSAKKLICDFVLLLFVSRQAVVFRIEKNYENQDYAGGSNKVIIHLYEQKDFVNPMPDFVTYIRSYLDVFKRVVLMSFLWITLAIVFLAGTNRVNVFSLGYLVGVFIFLWQGSDIYLKTIPFILRSWNWLLGYNVSVIMIKTFLQILGCIYDEEMSSDFCWAKQLFGIGCIRKFYVPIVPGTPPAKAPCEVPREYVGLVWDGLCFGFLIMMRRIFHSYNFFHMINEIKASTILASRGAELIEELRVKQMMEKDEQERTVLQKIKAKMDRIKATQQKIQGAAYKDTTNHYVDQPQRQRSSSMTSCASTSSQHTSPAGYHTPIEEDEHPPLTPRSSLMQQQAPSPYSAVMTVSLEGYLEPQRISFNSPPNSDLNPCPPSPDDSFPVFSPPPYDAAPPYAEVAPEVKPVAQRQTSVGPPWMQGSLVTPRQSIISFSSRSRFSHHEYSVFSRRPKYRGKPPKSYKAAIRSGDYYMFDMDDEELGLSDEEHISEDEEEQKSSKLSLGEVEQQKSVTILEKSKSEDSEPKPGTSKDEELSDISEPKKLPVGHKILNGLLFIWGFIESVMISLTNFLNRRSKDYRYVMKVLTKEKKVMKEKTNYTEGFMVGTIWQPMNSYCTLLTQAHEESEIDIPSDGTISPTDSYRNDLPSERINIQHSNSEDKRTPSSDADSDTKALAVSLPPSASEPDRRKASVLTVPEIRILAPSLERGLDTSLTSSHHSAIDELDMLDNTEMSSYDQPTWIRMLLAIWFTIMSRSEMLCYFIVFLNQIKSAGFLSLPLPLMVFFWGTLTKPRPSKTFWVTLIAYTEIIVLLKCMFQFDMIDWNKNSSVFSNPFLDPPGIIGIERQKNYALWDLLLLLVIFFHRFMLKSLGLWKTSTATVAALSSGEYSVAEDGTLIPIHGQLVRTYSRRKSVTLRDASFIPIESRKKSIDKIRKLSIRYSKKSVRFLTFSRFSDKADKDASKSESSSASSKTKPTRRSSDLEHLVEEEDEEEIGENSENIVSVESKEVTRCGTVGEGIKESFGKYFGLFKTFFKQLMDPTSRVADDVYSLMFLCDFFNFFVILFGYSAFGTQQGDGGVSSYIEDNRVPVLFLLMLILQFMLIIIDRGIFLRKNILAKLVFQFSQIILLHVWLFIIYPIITERKFNSVIPPQLYYMVKCFYLLLSAYQIRCGYPTRILGNFLCKGYTYVNMFLYRGFLMVPFLFELRTVMDWMWTDTSMTVFDWIKMEDIFSNIFLLKCTRHVEDEYPQPRGERKSPLIKYLMGGFILAFIVAIIWFPLVFFSLGNAVGKPNVPHDVTLELRIGPYEPVYQMSAQSNSIYSFSETEYKSLMNVYKDDRVALAFISNYEPADIAAVKLSMDSANIWSISPPDRKRMVQEINSTNPVTIRLGYKVSHSSNKPEDAGIISESVELILPPATKESPSPARENLLSMLTGNRSASPALLNLVLPKFLKVTNKGTAKAISTFMDLILNNEKSRSYRSLNLTMLHTNNTNATLDQVWWQISEITSDYNYLTYLNQIPHNDENAIIMYTFNDKIFSATLSVITGGGIIGLYTTFVFVASRIIHGFFTDQLSKIMFDDMPNVDRILQLCYDVYLVREVREFSLEEDLFAKLVFLFRSPETLIKWSRPKEELDDDEDPEGEGN